MLSALKNRKLEKTVFRNINIPRNKQVLYFKQVSVTCRKILNRKNKKQEKNSFQNLPVFRVNFKVSPLLFLVASYGPGTVMPNEYLPLSSM